MGNTWGWETRGTWGSRKLCKLPFHSSYTYGTWRSKEKRGGGGGVVEMSKPQRGEQFLCGELSPLYTMMLVLTM